MISILHFNKVATIQSKYSCNKIMKDRDDRIYVMSSRGDIS